MSNLIYRPTIVEKRVNPKDANSPVVYNVVRRFQTETYHTREEAEAAICCVSMIGVIFNVNDIESSAQHFDFDSIVIDDYIPQDS